MGMALLAGIPPGMLADCIVIVFARIRVVAAVMRGKSRSKDSFAGKVIRSLCPAYHWLVVTQSLSYLAVWARVHQEYTGRSVQYFDPLLRSFAAIVDTGPICLSNPKS